MMTRIYIMGSGYRNRKCLASALVFPSSPIVYRAIVLFY